MGPYRSCPAVWQLKKRIEAARRAVSIGPFELNAFRSADSP